MNKLIVFVKKLTGTRLFLPLFCLVLVLLSNLMKTPTFFQVTLKNGVLYGYIIDVINRASDLVILSVGMTMVVAASGGTDISVGAVMSVAGAVCCYILSGGQQTVNAFQNPWIPGGEDEDPAHGSDLDPVYGRAGYGTADHQRADHLHPGGVL